MANNLEPTTQDVNLYTFLRDLDSRVRIQESKHFTLRERTEIINRNMLNEHKRVIKELKSVNEEISDLKEEVTNLKESLNRIMREMSLFARKENLKVLEKYINLLTIMGIMKEEDVEKRGAEYARTA